jgi:hypothetical protein
MEGKIGGSPEHQVAEHAEQDVARRRGNEALGLVDLFASGLEGRQLSIDPVRYRFLRVVMTVGG